MAAAAAAAAARRLHVVGRRREVYKRPCLSRGTELDLM